DSWWWEFAPRASPCPRVAPDSFAWAAWLPPFSLPMPASWTWSKCGCSSSASPPSWYLEICSTFSSGGPRCRRAASPATLGPHSKRSRGYGACERLLLKPCDDLLEHPEITLLCVLTGC